jgi:hypothetical protein
MRTLRNTILAGVVLLSSSAALAAPASAVTGTLRTTAYATATLQASTTSRTFAPQNILPAARKSNPRSPIPSCGDAFQLYRTGELVKVSATASALARFGKGSMLVYAEADGEVHGPYGASSTGGARFSFYTDSSSQTTVAISLVNGSNTATLCAQDYYV